MTVPYTEDTTRQALIGRKQQDRGWEVDLMGLLALLGAW